MDEILRAKKLRAEILLRHASIKEGMSAVNKSLAGMQLIEQSKVCACGIKCISLWV